MYGIVLSKSNYKVILIGFFLFLFSLFSRHAFADTTGILLPNADGNYKQWTPSTGANHYALVDESTCNGAVDFVRTSSLNSRDSYSINIASILNGSTINQIAITPCASKNQNGGSNSGMKVFYRLNNVNSADSSAYILTGITPVTLSPSVFPLSLVKSSLTTLEIGGVFVSGNKGARLSRIHAVVSYTPLFAPSNLSAAALSTSSVQLNWFDNSSNEDGFIVERSASGSNIWTEAATLPANTGSYSDNGLLANTTYDYRVKAYNSGGQSTYSNIATVITQAILVPLPPSNVFLYATVIDGSSSGTLTWQDNSNDESGFEVQRFNDFGIFESLITTGPNVSWVVDPIATTDYRVRAFNQYGFSLWAYLEIIL